MKTKTPSLRAPATNVESAREDDGVRRPEAGRIGVLVIHVASAHGLRDVSEGIFVKLLVVAGNTGEQRMKDLDTCDTCAVLKF